MQTQLACVRAEVLGGRSLSESRRLAGQKRALREGDRLGFLRHGSGVQWREERTPSGLPLSESKRHWHALGLDIPRPVAPLQSLTPLLQAHVL